MEAVLSLRDRLSGPLGRATRSVENHQETFRRVNIAMAGAATVLGGALQSAIDRTGVGYEGIEDRVDDLAGATAGGTSLTKADALNRHWPPGDGRQRRCGYGRVCSVAASVGCSLVSGRVSVPKPLSQIQRSTRWLLQGLSPRPSFGGFGLRGSLSRLASTWLPAPPTVPWSTP